MYLYETHLHTGRCSACGRNTTEEMVNAAVGCGLAGIIVTNHFYRGNTAIDRNIPWEDFVGAYEEDYQIAKKTGEAQGLQVFFGLEEVFAPGKEMLIYGLASEVIAGHPEWKEFTLEEMSAFVRKNGGLCVYAHPFRHRNYIPEPVVVSDPDLFDGVEVYNACNEDADNLQAFLYAKNNGKFMISGSDTHDTPNFRRAGMAFETRVKDYGDLLHRFQTGEGKLINSFGLE